MWIFPPLFPRESPGISPHENFPHSSLKISKNHKRPHKGSQLWKIIPVMFYCQFFGNWNVYRFGEISLSFQPGILGEIDGMFLQGNFQTVLYSLQQMIHVDKSTCLSSSKFHRKQHDSVSDLIHFLLIVDIRWILPGFPCFWGYQVDASPKFSPFPYPCARSAPFLYEQLDFR